MTKIGIGAQVDSRAEIEDSAEIGAYSIIEANVKIGRGTKIGSHTIINENTQIGSGNTIHSYSVIGADPQTHKHREAKEEGASVIIGDNNVIHEFVTISKGEDEKSGRVTRIGDGNLCMAYSHIGHDSVLSNNIILVNQATLAGHVTVDDYAIIGAFCGVHQFCRVGESAMLSKGALINKDIMPYVMAVGNPPRVAGLNKVGLIRRGFSKELINTISIAYKKIFKETRVVAKTIENLLSLAKEHNQVLLMSEFLEKSTRGILR